MKGTIRVILAFVIILGYIGRSEIDPSLSASELIISLTLGVMLGFSGISAGLNESK